MPNLVSKSTSGMYLLIICEGDVEVGCILLHAYKNVGFTYTFSIVAV